MALTREQSLIWQAMNIGPQWILRGEEDPLDDVASAKAAPAAASQAHGQTAVVRPTVSSTATPPARPAATIPVNARSPLANRNTRPAARTAPVAAPAPVLAQADFQLVEKVKTAQWDEIAKMVDACHACPMSSDRTHTVTADGAPGCPIVIVGEAPGRDEDIAGIPFVGKSGQLLTAILEAVGLTRKKDVAIVNVLKCRPPKNRNPKPDEIEACSHFLKRQLELLEPKVLLLMGSFAIQSVLGRMEAVSKLRNETYTVNIAGRDVPTIVSYHPSYLLRSLVEKEKGWHDVLRARKLLESLDKKQ
ncbi:MAG: uracil-DNA glycosylase [Sutterellaceae bacterium]|nr:uracil-DNA glycosylase [Sutterellaceae bacterium]